MPIIKSAKKRVKVAAKANIANAKTKRTMREALKAFSKSLSGGTTKEIADAERAAMSAIDVAAKKAVIHKNTAARKKAQLSAKAKKSGVKPSKAAVKKPTPAPKKAVTKKSPAKKTTKKPAAKK